MERNRFRRSGSREGDSVLECKIFVAVVVLVMYLSMYEDTGQDTRSQM